jgi:hypothetical protein
VARARSAGARPDERPALFGADAPSHTHRHCTPVRLSRGDCSFQFGGASPRMMGGPQPRGEAFGAGANTKPVFALP